MFCIIIKGKLFISCNDSIMFITIKWQLDFSFSIKKKPELWNITYIIIIIFEITIFYINYRYSCVILDLPKYLNVSICCYGLFALISFVYVIIYHYDWNCDIKFQWRAEERYIYISFLRFRNILHARNLLFRSNWAFVSIG